MGDPIWIDQVKGQLQKNCSEDSEWVAIELTRCGSANQWLLEIADGNGKTITWPGYFATSETALQAANKIIEYWDTVLSDEVRVGTSPVINLLSRLGIEYSNPR